MKKIFTQVILLAIFSFATANLAAQTYIINDGGTYTIQDGWSTKKTKQFEIASPRPADQLTFNFSKSNAGVGGVTVKATYADGSSEEVIKRSTSSNPSYSFGRKIVTKLEFYADGSTSPTLKKEISSVKLTQSTYADAPKHNLWEPTAVIGSADAVAETTLDWSNVAPFTLTLSGNGASRFTCAITNNSSVGNYGTATITATYKHNVAGVDSATLTLTNGTTTYEIALVGTTTKKNQSITWATDLLSGKLPAGKEVATPATTLSGLPITYTSSDENIITIINEGTGIKALAAGQATVVATQVGDGEWNEVTDTIELTVTEKKIQYIHWTDNLTRLTTDSDPVELTATAQLLVNAETGEMMDDPERTALITYISGNESVVSISGNVLTVVGVGETTVTATLPGDEVYEETLISMPVRVRVPSTTCESYVLSATEEYSLEYSVLWQERIYEPAAFTGPAHILTFEARKERSEAVGNIQIQQYVNGDWHTIDDANPGTDWREYYYELDPNATKIRFYNGYGSYHRYWKNVLVTQRTYLETTTPAVTVEQSIIGSEITRTIAVQYSNLSAGVTVSNVSDKVILSTSELATECGKHGEEIITLTIRPTEIGTIQDIVTIHDEATGLTLTIPVTIHTQRKTQTIVWEDDVDSVYVTDDITLTATAVTAIHYTSSDSTVAYVNEANQLKIQTLGSVTITAHAAESEDYQAAQLSKLITIVHAQPVISVLPTVEPVGYGVALTNDMLVGGEANVDGVFVWNFGGEQPELIPGEHNLPILFVPDNKELYADIDTTVLVTVLKSQQTIVWNDDLSHVTVGDTILLSASANTEVIYESSDMEIVEIEDNRAIFLKAGAVTIYAQALEDEYYLSTMLAKDATVYPAEIDGLVTQYPTATEITYGQLLSASVLEGGVASVEGEFAWVDGNLSLSAGTYYMQACFIPAESDLYAEVVFYVEVVVNPAPQEITWELEVPVIVFLGDTVQLTAVATSGLEVSYSIDNEEIATLDGDKLIPLAVGDVTVVANQDGMEDEFQNYIPAEPVSYVFTIVKNEVETSLEQLLINPTKAYKQIRNGQMVIVCGEHVYNVLGGMIK